MRVNRSDIKGHDSETEQEISDPVTGLEGIKWSPNLDLKDSKSQSSRVPPETLPSVISANNVPVTKPSHTSTPGLVNAQTSNTLTSGNTYFKVPSVSFRTPTVTDEGTLETVKPSIQDNGHPLKKPDVSQAPTAVQPRPVLLVQL